MPACAGGISTRIILRSMLISDVALEVRSVSIVDPERLLGPEVSQHLSRTRRTAATGAPADAASRECALGRARGQSPFLREAAAARPDLVRTFVENGAAEAVEAALATSAETVEAQLRRQRTGVALTVALGDLAGELGFE